MRARAWFRIPQEKTATHDVDKLLDGRRHHLGTGAQAAAVPPAGPTRAARLDRCHGAVLERGLHEGVLGGRGRIGWVGWGEVGCR